MKNILPILTVVGVFLMLTPQADAGRIVNRRVKDAPKVCAVMKEDKFLSKENKQVFGTLKHSVVIEDNISILNDLGKKECQWPFEKLNIYAEVDSFNYYIDEYKNYIYPYFKNVEKNSYTMLKVSLATCEIEDSYDNDKLEFPKCSKPPAAKKSKSKKKRSVARS
jgi:hypothetical protein